MLNSGLKLPGHGAVTGTCCHVLLEGRVKKKQIREDISQESTVNINHIRGKFPHLQNCFALTQLKLKE